MNILLDTCSILWWFGKQEISDEATTIITDKNTIVCFSSVSIWEMSIKQSLGKLKIPDDLVAVVSEHMKELQVVSEAAWLAGQLPQYHKDPFDRMLIAQAKLCAATIVTRDAMFSKYDVETITI